MRRKLSFSSLFLALLLFAGMSLLLYPTVSELWNRRFQAMAIVTYKEEVSGLSKLEYETVRDQAEAYNRNIEKRNNLFALSDDEQMLYESLLRIDGNGLMGYIDIPSISVSLPIYHGVSERVLQIGVGHLEWTALPVGGEGTHCVLSGHRGLPSSRLFTDLDKVKEGDSFSLHILDEIYTYKVDQILTVLPEETDELRPIEGQDLCTLVTCTPYGINTHRLFVRGHRIATPVEREKLEVSSEATITDSKTVAVFIAVPVLLILFIMALLIRPKRGTYKMPENRAKAALKVTEKSGRLILSETRHAKKGGAHLK